MTDELYRCSGAPDCTNEGCLYFNPHDCAEQGCSSYACLCNVQLSRHVACVPVEQEPKPELWICPKHDNCRHGICHIGHGEPHSLRGTCGIDAHCPACVPYEQPETEQFICNNPDNQECREMFPECPHLETHTGFPGIGHLCGERLCYFSNRDVECISGKGQPEPVPLDLCRHAKTYLDCDIDCQGACVKPEPQPGPYADLTTIKYRMLEQWWTVSDLVREIERITGLRERLLHSHREMRKQRDEAYDERNEIEAEANAVAAVYLNDALEICAALGVEWEPMNGKTPDPTAVNAYPTMALEEIKRLRDELNYERIAKREITIQCNDAQMYLDASQRHVDRLRNELGAAKACDDTSETLRLVRLAYINALIEIGELRAHWDESLEISGALAQEAISLTLERDELRESAKLADAEIERLRKERNIARGLNDYYRKQFVQAKELYKKLRWELHLARTKS